MTALLSIKPSTIGAEAGKRRKKKRRMEGLTETASLAEELLSPWTDSSKHSTDI